MAEKTVILMIDDEEDFTHFMKLNLESTSEFEVHILRFDPIMKKLVFSFPVPCHHKP